MSVTCYYNGRMGNCVFSAAFLIAYAKKHNLEYYLPAEAVAYNHFRSGNIATPLNFLKSTGKAPINPTEYAEPNEAHGTPQYHDIPRMDNVVFRGYYQSFKYFDWCRDYILEVFNLPYEMQRGVVSLSSRRGDCVGSTAFPIAPPEYYRKAIVYMQERGYNLFRVFSDDQEWCRNEFTSENYHGAEFEFSEGKSEMDDYVGIANCEHNITARSTFSLTAAWFNRNPNKIVLVPQEKIWWRGQNKDLIPEYFTQIEFAQMENLDMQKYVFDYGGGTFTIIANKWWSEIANGQAREELYYDYKVMIDVVKKVDKERYILDIGANVGVFAVPVSKLGYKVFGFEPVKMNIDSLELARVENNLKQFEIFHAALSDKNGEVEIYVPECHDNASLSKDAAIANMNGKEYSVEKVPSFRFDDWIKTHDNFDNIGFIKIDAQGAEYSILEGMKDYLQRMHNIYLVAEYEHHLNTMGHTFEELDNLITSYGFKHQSTTGNDRYFYKQ